MALYGLVALGAFGALLSYLAFRDFPLLSTFWGNLAALSVSLALFVFTTGRLLESRVPWLASFVLVGCVTGITHAIYLASLFGEVVGGVAKGFAGDGAIHVKPTFDQADAAVARGDYARAEQLYRESAAAHPKAPAPHLRLSDLFLKQQLHRHAAEELRQAVTLAEDSRQESIFVFRLADVLAKQMQQPQAARDVLQQFIERRPDTKFARFARERLEGLG